MTNEVDKYLKNALKTTIKGKSLGSSGNVVTVECHS